jgi:hypothetical protein
LLLDQGDGHLAGAGKGLLGDGGDAAENFVQAHLAQLGAPEFGEGHGRIDRVGGHES